MGVTEPLPAARAPRPVRPAVPTRRVAALAALAAAALLLAGCAGSVIGSASGADTTRIRPVEAAVASGPLPAFGSISVADFIDQVAGVSEQRNDVLTAERRALRGALAEATRAYPPGQGKGGLPAAPHPPFREVSIGSKPPPAVLVPGAATHGAGGAAAPDEVDLGLLFTYSAGYVSQILPAGAHASFTGSGASGTARSRVVLTGTRGAMDSVVLDATTTSQRDGLSLLLKSRASVVGDQCPAGGALDLTIDAHTTATLGGSAGYTGRENRDVRSTVHASVGAGQHVDAARYGLLQDTSRVVSGQTLRVATEQVVRARGSMALGASPTFRAGRVNLVRSSSDVGSADLAHVSSDGLGSALQLGIGATHGAQIRWRAGGCSS